MSKPSALDDATAAGVPRGAEYFRTDDLLDGIGRRSARGGAYTFASSALNFAVTTVTTVLITRELTDEDFGLYGMVIVFAGFAGMFADLGLSRAVVQKPQIKHEQVSTLFWINLAIAGGLAIVLAASTPWIVALYDEPRLVPINFAMAALFLVHALGRQHKALLERRMEFGRINAIAAITTPLGAMTGLVVAILGGGYWALVTIPAATAIASSASLWLACSWIPGLPRRGTGVREMLAFGANVTGFQVINYFARNADNAMLGYAWGAGPLGLYTRAYSLMMLPAQKVNTPLTGVVVPALSRLAEDHERYRRAFRRVVGLAATLTTPLIALGIVLSPELIPLVLGEKWAPMTPVFIALSGAALHAATNAVGGWVALSLGLPQRMFRLSIVTAPLSVIAMAIGLQWGPLGVAIAVSAWQLLAKIPGFIYITRGTFLSVRDLLVPIAFPTLASLSGCAAAVCLRLAVDSFADDPGTTLIVGVKTAGYVGTLALLTVFTPAGRATLGTIRTIRTTLRGSPG
ncbi:MAG: lipopolysaccharide biosynthesis protein [Phycisphaeraceae bacterium]